MKPVVFIGIPCHMKIIPQRVTDSAMNASPILRNEGRLAIESPKGSLSAWNMNRAFCAAVRSKSPRYTHFLLHHADIAVVPGFLDTMLCHMEHYDCDVLSAVVPFKDETGLTSTGWQDKDLRPVTRFTLHDVYGTYTGKPFPMTFDVEDAGHPGELLMLNTGIMLCRLGPWVRDFPGFNQQDAIVWYDEETPTAQCSAEDWNFSYWAQAQAGLRVMATSAPKLVHIDLATGVEYPNTHGWGTWKADKIDYVHQPLLEGASA